MGESKNEKQEDALKDCSDTSSYEVIMSLNRNNCESCKETDEVILG